MAIKQKLAKLSPLFQSAVVIFISALFVCTVVYASTTIGTDITTQGALTVTGLTTSGTLAVTGLSTSGSLTVTGLTTSGTLTVTGLSTLSTVTASSATTTDSLKIGGYASTTGDLFVNGGTIDTSTGAPTTTLGVFVRDNFSATSTLSVGRSAYGAGGAVKGCLEMTDKDGVYHACTIDTAGTSQIKCGIGRCKD